MLKLFEEQTKPITDYERNTIVPLLISGLKARNGKDKAITSKEICAALKAQGYKINDVSLRKCVKYIQRNSLLEFIIASSEGFYYTNDPKEVEDQIASLRGREAAIRSVREALEESLNRKKAS
jgi:hypothetical protein